MPNYISFLFLSLVLIFNSPANASAVHEHHEVHVVEPPANSLRSSGAAEEIIHSIVSSVGLKPNFEVREGKISNAAAVIHKGKRFILYDAKFIDKIQNATKTDWAGVSILAHEIGHHLNGHTLMGKGNYNVALELEADEFSGFILRQMGASLEDAQKALRLMSSVKESSSHPGREARMAAIEKGYIAANDRILAYADQPKVHIAASAQPEEPARRKKTAKSLSEDNIYKEVHFNGMPESTFYLTHELKLITITDNGPAVFGEITRNNNRLILNINDRNAGARSFLVSKKGMIVDDRNKVIGRIKNRA